MNQFDFTFFFERLNYFLSKGRGFSIFNSNEKIKDQFLSECRKNKLKTFYAESSSLTKSEISKLSKYNIIVLYQDLPFDRFIAEVQTIVDKLLFPCWFTKKVICFFSTIDKSEYKKRFITSTSIHRDYDSVINFLLCEQLIALLDRCTYQFTANNLLKIENNIFTPVEMILKNALDEAQIQYHSQVGIGSHYFDFLLNYNGKEIFVEIDSRVSHTISNIIDSDRILKRKDSSIIHFSSSEIINSVQTCLDTIRTNVNNVRINKFKIDDDLDESQSKATDHIAGPIRVLAPAGSGKTKTLINRIVNLNNCGIQAGNILALAFNKKASEEMIARLKSKQITNVEVRTFHSFGYQILQKKFGWQFDSAKEKTYQRNLMKDAIQQHVELPQKRNVDVLDKFLSALRKTKLELIPITEVNIDLEDQLFPFEPIFNTYLKLQSENKFINFDDMIYFAVRILLDDDSMREHYQNKFQFVLVDEFQDLNRAQLLLLQILSLPENNVFIVGDDDQMIYGWRGAEVGHIINFKERYPVTQDCLLSTNYRSSKKIVRHSQWLIDHNKERIKKEIKPRYNAPEGYLDIHLSETLWEQANSAADWLINFKNENNFRWKDFAVLFRLNAYQFPIATIFDRKKIPHSPVSNEKLFKTRVGIDLYAYLTLTLYPNDATSSDFSRTLKRPNKYLSNALIASINSWNDLQAAVSNCNLKPFESEKIKIFFNRIDRLQSIAVQKEISPQVFLTQLSAEVGLADFYKAHSLSSMEPARHINIGPARYIYIGEAGGLDEASDDVVFEVILSVAKNFDRIKDFYRYINKAINAESRDSEIEADRTKDEVVLTTIHRTKGNEYQNVIYFNLNQDVKHQEESEIEEERRVTYVGVTRAKENIFITGMKQKPSEFLIELTLNPKLKSYSFPLLDTKLHSTKHQLTKVVGKINSLRTKKETLKKRCEYFTSRQFINKFSFGQYLGSWLNEKKTGRLLRQLNITEFKIRHLMENRLPALTNTVKELETEIKFRTLLQKNKAEKYRMKLM